MESYQVAGQLSIFDYPEFLPEKPDKKRHILKVGDKIGKIILGECEITTVMKEIFIYMKGRAIASERIRLHCSFYLRAGHKLN